MVNALINKSESQLPENYQHIPEDIYNEDERRLTETGMGDFVVLIVGVAVIAPDETLQLQPCCGMS